MDTTQELLSQVAPLVIQWRRQLHQMAELSGYENETAAYITAELKKMPGISISYPCKTGVVGTLKGNNTNSACAFRADIDALPIEEETGLSFASKHSGVMHACGHDGNAAMVLGAAWVLSHMQEQRGREIRFIFEPGEETPPGFSSEIVASGSIDGVEALYAVHVDAFTPVRHIRACAGHAMAANARFTIEIIGDGGHAAFPHQCVDTVYISSMIVGQLQSIPAHIMDPIQPCVITVTSLRSNTEAYNVIPSKVTIKGTVRCLQDDQLDTIVFMVKKMAIRIAQTYSADATFSSEKGYGSLYNDPLLCKKVQNAVSKLYGEGSFIKDVPVMGGEAFSVYSKYVPVCYIKVGTMVETGTPYPHHHCKFDMNEKGLLAGVSLMVDLAEKR